METKNVSAFNNGIIKHNTWLEDTREIIIKEEGDSYNKYLCSMFRGYLSRDDKEIIDAIKDEGRKWTQGNTWKQLLILWSYESWEIDLQQPRWWRLLERQCGIQSQRGGEELAGSSDPVDDSDVCHESEPPQS